MQNNPLPFQCLCKNTAMTTQKHKLPKGKLNIRHRQMRNVWQVFVGRTYLDGCAGENEDVALDELCFAYDVPSGIEVSVHGYNEPTTITTP